MRIAALMGCLAAVAPAPAVASDHLESFNPPGSAFAFAQTPDGFLWIGTFGDLLRHDGVSLRSAREGSGLRASAPWAGRLAVTEDGRLWMGLGGVVARFDAAGRLEPEMRGEGGLEVRTGGTWRRLGPEQGLRNPIVWSFCSAGDGGMWVGTEAGLGLLERMGARGSAEAEDRVVGWYGRAQGLADDVVLALDRDPQGAIWIGTPRGLQRLGGRSAAPSPPVLTDPVTALAHAGAAIWAATPHGLAKVEAGRVIQRFGRKDGLPAEEVTAMVAARDGVLWIGTRAGLARLEPGARRADPVAVAFEHAEIAALFEDADGQIWVGTFQDGVRKLAPSLVQTFAAAEGIEGAPRMVARDERNLWIVTGRGVAEPQGRDRFLTHDLPEASAPRGVAPDARGDLWLATNRGVTRATRAPDGAWTPGQVTGLPAAAASALVWAGDRLWIASSEGGLTRARRADEAGAMVIEAQHQGGCAGGAVSLAQDHEGTLWAAHPGGGVTRITSSGETSCLGRGEGLTGLEVESVAVDSRGRVWVGALADRGLHAFANGRFWSLRARHGLYCDSIYEVVPTPDEGLWLVCGSGVVWTHAGTLAREAVRPRPFVSGLAVPAERLASTPATKGAHPSAVVDATGALWVATQAGITRVSPTIRTVRAPGTVAFESLRLDGRSVELTTGQAELTISGLRPRLEIELAVATLVSAVRPGFAFRLDGAPLSVVHDGPRRIQVEALGVGDHRLDVLVADGQGSWRPTAAALTIHVRAPLWRRWEPWVSALVLAGALLALLHKARMLRLERRYQAVQAERARIARELHDALGQVFAGITLHVDAALRLVRGKDERTASVLERAKGIAQQGREDVRRAIWELRAETLEAPPLAEALGALVARMRRADGPAIELRVNGPPPPRSAEIEFELLRVAEEALTNAVAHASPSHVDVVLDHAQGAVSLSIVDDGRGLHGDPASLSAGGHFGLLGIAERARRLDADLRIDPGRDGRGTEVKLIVPDARFARRST